MDVLDLHQRALAEFDRRVHAVPDDRWHAPTPCTGWDVRRLVGHLVYEQLWVPHLMHGATLAQVGDRFDGDQLGDDPVKTWSTASTAAREALTEPDALTRTVHTSGGPTPAVGYAWELTTDLAVHAWDLARGIGADDTIDPDLAAAVYTHTLPHADRFAATGLFAPSLPINPDADPQTKLLALLGRQR